MSKQNRHSLLATAPSHILWTVEHNGIRIFNRQSDRHYVLEYPAAAVWDLLIRKRSIAQLIPILRAIQQVSAGEAAALVQQCLYEWHERGLIEIEEPDGESVDHHPVQ